jgi:hypothetical protein
MRILVRFATIRSGLEPIDRCWIQPNTVVELEMSQCVKCTDTELQLLYCHFLAMGEVQLRECRVEMWCGEASQRRRCETAEIQMGEMDQMREERTQMVVSE